MLRTGVVVREAALRERFEWNLGSASRVQRVDAWYRGVDDAARVSAWILISSNGIKRRVDHSAASGAMGIGQEVHRQWLRMSPFHVMLGLARSTEFTALVEGAKA